jgi:hypothetical protein
MQVQVSRDRWAMAPRAPSSLRKAARNFAKRQIARLSALSRDSSYPIVVAIDRGTISACAYTVTEAAGYWSTS